MNILTFLSVLGLISLDQSSKWAVQFYNPSLIFENTGLAFGLVERNDLASIASVVTILIFLGILLRSVKFRPSKMATIFILGGAFSNLSDRVLHGAILDYISVPYFSTFNLADIFIFVGVAAYAYQIFRK